MTYQIITANRLTDGLVVFLGEGGCWVDDLGNAESFDAEAVDAALALINTPEQDTAVVGPYAIEVAKSEDGEVSPVKYRERIRAYGPSTHTDFARVQVPSHFSHPDNVTAVQFSEAR